MHVFINSIEFIKLLNWVNKFDNDGCFCFKLLADTNQLLVSVSYPEFSDFSSFYAFYYVNIDNIIQSSDDVYSISFESLQALKTASPENSEQIELETTDYQLKFYYLNFVGKSYFDAAFNFDYATLKPVPGEHLFNREFSVTKSFHNYLKFCNDYLTFSKGYAYSNSDVSVSRYAVDLDFDGSVVRGNMLTLTPGNYRVYVGKRYICFSGQSDIYCIPYVSSMTSYSLTDSMFDVSGVTVSWQEIRHVVGQKLAKAGFSISKAGNVFLLRNGLVEFLFLDA